jgi:hypothetical protein
MAVSEQVRLATVEDHVRGENARDLDVIRVPSTTARMLPLYITAFRLADIAKFAAPMRSDSTRCRISAS